MRDYEECQPYIDKLLVEHRRLRQMLREAQEAIAGGGGDPSAAVEAVLVLTNIRDELAHHFAEEEEGGCLEEAVLRCPQLAGETRRIEAEHPRILAGLDGLIAQAKKGMRTPRDRAALAQKFDHVCQEVHAHEAAENRLLRQGFNTMFNGEELGEASPLFDE